MQNACSYAPVKNLRQTTSAVAGHSYQVDLLALSHIDDGLDHITMLHKALGTYPLLAELTAPGGKVGRSRLFFLLHDVSFKFIALGALNDGARFENLQQDHFGFELSG